MRNIPTKPSKIEIELPIRRLVTRIVTGLILLSTPLIMLQKLIIQLFFLSSGLSVACLEINLALQRTFINLLAGLEITIAKAFQVDQFIDLLREHKQAQAMDSCTTKLLILDQFIVVNPKRKIISKILQYFGKIYQPNLPVGLAYATDLSHFIATVSRVVNAIAQMVYHLSPVISIGPLRQFSIHNAISPLGEVPNPLPAQVELYPSLIEAFQIDRIPNPLYQEKYRMHHAI